MPKYKVPYYWVEVHASAVNVTADSEDDAIAQATQLVRLKRIELDSSSKTLLKIIQRGINEGDAQCLEE
jgi:hypothetical protein